MIVGGYTANRRYKFLIFSEFFLFFQSDAETEVWTMVNGSNKTIKPSLQHMHYTYGIALYAVDFDFCRK